MPRGRQGGMEMPGGQVDARENRRVPELEEDIQNG